MCCFKNQMVLVGNHPITAGQSSGAFAFTFNAKRRSDRKRGPTARTNTQTRGGLGGQVTANEATSSCPHFLGGASSGCWRLREPSVALKCFSLNLVSHTTWSTTVIGARSGVPRRPRPEHDFFKSLSSDTKRATCLLASLPGSAPRIPKECRHLAGAHRVR